MTVEFPWLLPLQPRPKNLWAPEEQAVWDWYEATHSLRRYPDGSEVEPPAGLRAKVLDITSRLPQLPPEWPQPGWFVPEVACITCEDRGEIPVGEHSLLMECPDCAGEWSWRAELFAEMDQEDR